MNKNMRRVRLVAQNVLEWGLYFGSLFVSKERGLVVFSMSRGRYWDNSRALFEHMAEYCAPGVRVVWLADPALCPDRVPESYKDQCVPRYSSRGWYLCARAEVVVISYGLGDFGLLREIAKRKKVVMLWHGITTKYCGLLDEKFNDARRKRYRRRETIYYDHLIASSDIDRYYSASYTGVDATAIEVTGLPRNDQLFREQGREETGRKWFSILYAPTFRDYRVEEGSVLFPFPHETREVAEWARDGGIRFFLRPHPSDLESVQHVQALSRAYPDVFLDTGVANCPDVMELILSCNGIVTDYSSTYVDGLALDRPVTFVDYDRKRYIESRGLAYDYDLITPGPKVRSWPDFQRACEQMAEGAEEWSANREFVRRMFFKYRDANACSRVAALIQGMVER